MKQQKPPKRTEMISANTKGSWHFVQSRTDSTKQNRPKKRKNRWKSREWVQPEVKTGARQLKKHISREFVGAVTQCHESKTNSEARPDHKCVSPLAATVMKALDSEDSARTCRTSRQTKDSYSSVRLEDETAFQNVGSDIKHRS